jgi:hypothetical protein
MYDFYNYFRSRGRANCWQRGATDPPHHLKKKNLLVICFCKKNMLEFQNACDYMLCLKTIIKNMPSKLYFYYKKYEIIHDF